VDGRCLKKEYICDGIPDCVVDHDNVLDEKKCSAPGKTIRLSLFC